MARARELRHRTGRAGSPVHFWSYPPHLVLFTAPLGLLSHVPAYVLWCIVGLALYLLASWSGGASKKHMLFLAFAPAVLVDAFFGQNGCLTAALVIGGLANLDRWPILAGNAAPMPDLSRPGARGVGVHLLGQNGFYAAALLIGGWLCRDRRPMLAGVVLGLLTLKPQIGLSAARGAAVGATLDHHRGGHDFVYRSPSRKLE